MLDPEVCSEAPRARRTIAVVGGAMIGSLVLYVLLVEFLRAQQAPFRGFAAFARVEILRYALFAVSLVTIVLLRVLRQLFLSDKAPVLQTVRVTRRSPDSLQRLATASIVSFALCESVAIYGLLLFLLAGNVGDFYLLSAMGLVLFVVCIPRRRTWEAWMERATRRGGR